MTRDEELLGVAIALVRVRGRDAPAHAAERLGMAVPLQDSAGIALWRAVAEAMSRLLLPQGRAA